MTISVRTGSALKALLDGNMETTAAGENVGEILDHLKIKDRICDSNDSIRRHFNIHVNEGEDIRLIDGLKTTVSDGDTVTILSAIAGGSPCVRKVWLTFPKDLIERPLLCELVRKFDVITNIRQASVSKDVAIVGLEISGEEDILEDSINFLITEGIHVEPIELNVVE